MSQRIIGISGDDTEDVAEQIEYQREPFENVRFLSVIVNNQADRRNTVQALVVLEVDKTYST